MKNHLEPIPNKHDPFHLCCVGRVVQNLELFRIHINLVSVMLFPFLALVKELFISITKIYVEYTGKYSRYTLFLSF